MREAFRTYQGANLSWFGIQFAYKYKYEILCMNFILYKEGNMAEQESTANNFIWAFALIIIVAMLAAVLFYGGGFMGGSKKQIDIKVEPPATSR